jgi:hypothetical protein
LAGFASSCRGKTASSTCSPSTAVSGAEALQKLLAGGDNVEPQCRGLEAAILEIRPPFTI